MVYEKKGDNTYKELYEFVDKGAVFDFPYRAVGTFAVEAYGGSKTFDTDTGKGGAYNLVHVKKLGGITNTTEIQKQKKELKEKPKVSRDLADIHLKTKDLIDSCDTIESLSEKRDLGFDTIIKHLGILKQVEKDLDLQKYLPEPKIAQIITKAIEKIKAKNDKDDFTEQGVIKLKPIFEELNGEVPYNDIKIMLL